MKASFYSVTLAIITALLFSGIGRLMASSGVPTPDHVVVVIMENHSYSQIIGSSSAPHINALTTDTDAAIFTQSFAIEHPSQPNYLDLFSGSNQGMTSDNLPGTFPFTTPNLGYELISTAHSFTTYSEDLPSVGYNGATSGNYARKHNPAANWMGTGGNDIATTTNQPFTAFPASSGYASLPTVSYVVPNLNDDMHNGTVAEGDTWFYTNMNVYIQWAKTHNSLLILTWDENDNSAGNQILTIFVGQMVKGGNYSETINHYRVLRTMEDMYGLAYAGSSSSQTPIIDCWRSVQSTGGTMSVSGNVTTCAGHPVTIGASGATAYQWSPGNQTTDSITVSPGSTTVYSVTGTVNGSPQTGTVTVTVSPLPVSAFTDVVTGDTVVLTSQSQNANSYVWKFGDGSSLNNVANTTYQYSASGTYTITLITENNCGSDTTSHQVTISVTSINQPVSKNEFDIYCLGTSTLKVVCLQDPLNSLVQMYSVNGALIAKKQIDISGQTYLDISNLSEGIYIVKIGDVVKKFFK